MNLTDAIKLERIKARLLGVVWKSSVPKREMTTGELRRTYTQRYNVVCFECRTSSRQPGGRSTCIECGKDMVSIGYRREVPRRRKRKAWAQLEKTVNRSIGRV